MTQAGYIPIQRDGRLDTSVESTSDAASDVLDVYGQLASGGQRRSRVQLWIGAELNFLRRHLDVTVLRRRLSCLRAGRRDGHAIHV